MSETERTSERLEYTETVLEFTPGADRATRLTRAYKVAQRTGEKAGPRPAKPKTRAASYQGKTVTIEKTPAGYTFKVDGKDLPAAEANEFRTEFGRDPKARPEDQLPTGPVRLDEAWTPGPVALKAVAAEVRWPVDVEKSRITGKLTRVYAEGGRQFGVIAFRTELAVGGGQGPTGSLTVEVTVDTAIDGSATGGTTRKNITGTLTGRQGGVELQVVLDVHREQKMRPVK
jgi:hypothetical protein